MKLVKENINEAVLQPDIELYERFKEIVIEVKNSNTNDPFSMLNDNLNDLNIHFIDFNAHLNAIAEEERETIKDAILMPPLGIRIMGYDSPTGRIMIIVDETFDNKFIAMPIHQLNMILQQLWSGFGHETIHKNQVSRMKVNQDPEFHSQDEYFSNKQEIMAMAFSFIEEQRSHHVPDKEILNSIKTSNNQPQFGMFRRMGPPQHPLLGIYKKLGGKSYKLFTKYVYSYIMDDDVNEDFESVYDKRFKRQEKKEKKENLTKNLLQKKKHY